MKHRICSTGLAVIAFAVAAGAASANLVANGGFESGDFTGWLTNAGDPFTSLSIINQPHTGTYAALFGSFGESEGVDGNYIGQNVGGVVSGATYAIELWVYNNGVGGDSLTIHWDGNVLYDESPVSLPLEEWSFLSFTAQAIVEGDFAFLLISGFDNKASFLIDDVSVTLVPAPGAAALLGMGALVASRRRRD